MKSTRHDAKTLNCLPQALIPSSLTTSTFFSTHNYNCRSMIHHAVFVQNQHMLMMFQSSIEKCVIEYESIGVNIVQSTCICSDLIGLLKLQCVEGQDLRGQDKRWSAMGWERLGISNTSNKGNESKNHQLLKAFSLENPPKKTYLIN